MNYNNILYTYLSDKVTVENIIKFFIVYFFIFWISILVWVYKDIINRTENIFYQIISILIILIFTPLFGIFIYLIIRPHKTLFERYYEEVEYNLESLNNQIKQTVDCNKKK